MVRMQITMDRELQKQARQRAVQAGVSFAEYVRTLLRRDLGESPPQATPEAVFDLGDSGGSDVARDKDVLVAAAVTAGAAPGAANE